MATTAVTAPAYELKSGVRKLGAGANIVRQGVEDMIDAIKADNFKLVSNAEGTRYLHIINTKKEEYFTIKVGKKVESGKRKGEDLIKFLLSECVIYAGTTENGIWFTFGPEPGDNEPEAEISLKDLMATKLAFYAG